MNNTNSTNNSMINQFNKIQLWNNMANQIAYFAFQHGNKTIFDMIDLKCGGIPDGSYEQIVDINSPYEFISLYTQIAENRFAFAVNELLKMSEKTRPVIKEFLYRTGKEMNIESINDINCAFEIFNSFILDGMPDKKSNEIITSSENMIQWKKLYDNHETAWNKACGDINFYYELQADFVNGLFSNSNFSFSSDGTDFKITEKGSEK